MLTDVEKIAPCLPGVQLQEVEGDEYRGIVKVKVGPITAQYKGAATFVEKDDANHRAGAQGRRAVTPVARGATPRRSSRHSSQGVGRSHQGIGEHRPHRDGQSRSVRSRGDGRCVGQAELRSSPTTSKSSWRPNSTAVASQSLTPRPRVTIRPPLPFCPHSTRSRRAACAKSIRPKPSRSISSPPPGRPSSSVLRRSLRCSGRPLVAAAPVPSPSQQVTATDDHAVVGDLVGSPPGLRLRSGRSR